MEDLETCSNNGTVKPDLQPSKYSDDIDSTVSTPSSPGLGPHGGGFFYSAPSSPMRHVLSSSYSNIDTSLEGAGGSFEFEFPAGSMSSADELFLNGQIRPMKLSSHIQRPQDLAPLNDGDEEEKFGRCRNLKSPLRRRARSMSLIRTNTAFEWLEEFKDGRDSTEITEIKEKLEAEEKQRGEEEDNEIPSSGASSRSSSVGRSSKRWVFLKELLSRSKSEGRNSTSSNKKLWSTLSFSPANKEKKLSKPDGSCTSTAEGPPPPKATGKKAVNGVGVNRKRRVGRSAHEVHYTTNRAQAEEMRKKTYLPYRPGLLGCLGFSSKSYGAMNGFARALNPVSSR